MQKKQVKLARLLAELRLGGELEIVIFPQDMILEVPIESWPVVDVLIAFYSNGFPLKKAEGYVKLRDPFCFNAIGPQSLLLDRRKIYAKLVAIGVPVPKHVVFDHTDPTTTGKLVQHEDYIEVSEVRINKPFVEKPADAERHDINIYYPDSVGGGTKRLFRKEKNESSAFYPDESAIRTDGAYVYEEYLPTEGTDLKVYTVGPKYAYAEARKAPTLDGRVVRDARGKEVRHPVLLTADEKEFARRISLAFGQMVNGFDILRAHGRSYVCDVNGWSFVKSSSAYYHDAAAVLRRMTYRALSGPESPFLAPREVPTPSSSSRRFANADADEDTSTIDNDSSGMSPHQACLPSCVLMHDETADAPRIVASPANGVVTGVHKPELRALISVIRHGDRTPKQKLKMKVRNRQMLDFFTLQGLCHSKKEIKLKKPKQLQQALDLVDSLLNDMSARLAPGSSASSDSDLEGVKLGQLRQLRWVLSQHPFHGVNRKLQVKRVSLCERTGEVSEAQLIMKWGGELTAAGRAESELLGRALREDMSKADGTRCLLHLHSTYRHDVKFYSSDEGRVQLTAAAVAKGLLELAGELPPILVSLIRKDDLSNRMLDDASAVAAKAAEIKDTLHTIMQMDVDLSTSSELQARLVPTAAPALVAPMLLIANPRGHVKQLHSSLRRLLSVLHAIRRKLGDAHTLYHGESLFLLYLRWSKLTRELHRPRRDEDAYEIVSDTWSCRTDPSLLARCPESTLHALRLPRAMPFVCAV